jgi:hypothetical protein
MQPLPVKLQETPMFSGSFCTVAVNVCIELLGTVDDAGATVTEIGGGGVTISVVEPEMAPDGAVIVALLPEATPVATPAAVIVATEGFEELQVTVEVMICVLPSL